MINNNLYIEHLNELSTKKIQAENCKKLIIEYYKDTINFENEDEIDIGAIQSLQDQYMLLNSEIKNLESLLILNLNTPRVIGQKIHYKHYSDLSD